MSYEIATLAGGCFWCTEAIFQKLRGVKMVQSGYAGEGDLAPSYEEVSSGESGFVEAVRVEFDPQIIQYKTILEVFFATHDPTSYDRQGADAGSQYRSVIFYQDEEQKKIAMEYVDYLEAEHKFADKIVTEIKSVSNFYPADAYHKNYYLRNSDAAYCRVVIDPKIRKLYKEYSEIIEDGNIKE
jgi:peptide-methionine (S)-S-oxide reductase